MSTSDARRIAAAGTFTAAERVHQYATFWHTTDGGTVVMAVCGVHLVAAAAMVTDGPVTCTTCQDVTAAILAPTPQG